MTDPLNLVIPAELKPADGRFGAGPSKVRPEQIAALSAVGGSVMGTSHRQKTVKSQVGRVRKGLSDLFQLPEGYEVVLGNGGSTAFWEVAVFGLLRDRGQFLTFGEFGSKFAAAAKDAPFVGDPVVIKSEPGTAPTFVAEKGIDLYATPHNETSTGVAVSLKRPAGIDDDALFVVDATSAAGGLHVDLGAAQALGVPSRACSASMRRPDGPPARSSSASAWAMPVGSTRYQAPPRHTSGTAWKSCGSTISTSSFRIQRS